MQSALAMEGVITFLLVSSIVSASTLDFDDIIERVNSAGAKWKAGPPTATASLMVGNYCAWKSPARAATTVNSTAAKIPVQFDSRKQWPHCPTIGQIRDQGKCGSCWAVAGASALSDRFCIATNGSFALPLSEEEVLSCCSRCGGGCSGGYHYRAWQFFAAHGIVTGGGYGSHVGCQPYEIAPCERAPVNSSRPRCDTVPPEQTPMCRRRCTNPSYDVPYSSDHRRTLSEYPLRNNVSEIQNEILSHGPVEAAFTVYSDFPTYQSGIYHHVTGEVISRHAVRIIGWGSEDDTPFWLIANSFNSDWGEFGFFRMLRGVNECGIEEDVTGGIPLV